MPSCPFEISSTNRYTSIDEAAIIARKDIEKGEIEFLCGILVRLGAEEAQELDQTGRSFSVVVTTRRNTTSLLIGPVQFVNHDCKPNARLEPDGGGTKAVATRKIWTGEEITLKYSGRYFGESNRDCLCETCQNNPLTEKVPQRNLRPRRGRIRVVTHPDLRGAQRHSSLYGFDWPRME